MSHVRQRHPNYKEEIQYHETSGTINSMFGTVTQKAKSLHGWIDLIVTGGYPFSMVEKSVVRKYIKLEPIDRHTLVSYMQNLTKSVEKNF